MTHEGPDLLAIAASNGENLKLAKHFVEAASARDASAELLDLTLLDLPVFTPRTQKDAPPSGLSELERHLSSAPRWVICAPEYNGSIPPVLSNAIAWLSVQGEDFRSLFNGRPVGIASVSGGGGMEVLLSMRIQLTHLGAQVVGRQLQSNKAKPPRQESVDDLVARLLQLHPLTL